MKQKYQTLVHHTIPISKQIGWEILSLSKWEIVTHTKLLPNINIHGTAFAGSIYAAAMASGWTLLKFWSDEFNFGADLVAAEANIQYLLPIDSDFICQSELNENSESYQKLVNRLTNSRNGRIEQLVEIKCNSAVCAILKIQFVFKNKNSNRR